ncbi:MAG: transporter substrate-binding domain-containing protein [Silicimonas sp.]|nr:transporter substrate-binding domain-containing protein [Silicimonas sp.]
MKRDLHSLAKGGVLRAAINTGNRALVQQDGDLLSGVSPALARRLAEEIGAELRPVIYEGAGKVFADAHNDAWDVGFLAVDETRAKKIAFTRPYHSIEATFAVRAGSELTDVAAVDRPGVKVLTSTGSAYDMHLTQTLMHAALERTGTPPESFAEFRDGRCDAVAGVRASLEGFFDNDAQVRILPGVLTAVHQAMVLPQKDDPRIAALDDFVARAVSDGFVAVHL